MKPAWNITANDIGLSGKINRRVDSIQYHDAKDGEADDLTIEFDDYDNALAIPPKGAKLSLKMGWHGKALHDKGVFVVDEVEHSGAPDRLVITARSADFRAAFRTLRSASWDAGITVTQVVDTLAQRYGLKPKVGDTLAALVLQQINQANESDSSLLARLGKQHDATATVKNGYLLFFPKGKGETATGNLLPVAPVHRSMTSRHSYKSEDKTTRFTGVEARWYDNDAAQMKVVVAGATGNLKKIRDPLPDQQQATEAAKSEWARVQRGAAKMSITIDPGMPELVNGQTVVLTGWKETIDAHDWLIDDLNHETGTGGLVTRVELVTKA